MKTKINLSFTLILAFLFAFNLNAQSPDNSYVIQENDWLSKVAEKAYGNPHLYYQIIEGTNAKAKSDNSFRPILRANDIQVGQKIWIPDFTSETVKETPKTEKPNSGLTNLTGVPQTNCEIRLWYNYQVVAIGKINEKWEKDGIDLETRAHKAYELRHEARVNARFMMQNPVEVKGLQARDMAKYGNPNGPTFDYLLNKNMNEKGMTKEEAFQSIIDSSSRTDRRFNEDCM